MGKDTTATNEDAGGAGTGRHRAQHVAGARRGDGAVVDLERLKQLLHGSDDPGEQPERGSQPAPPTSLPRQDAGARGKHRPAQHRADDDQIWLL